jgi:predicted DCC family thiol-disulfide oxidoreductase YuxK
MATSTFTPLPNPTDRPQADVVIYDGECKFCTGTVHKLNRLDRHQRFSYLSLHDPETTRRYPDLQFDEMMKYMFLCPAAGGRLRGAEGFKYMSTRIPGMYWMAPLLYLPGLMPVWQFFYQMFAKRRYRWGRIESCENGTCKLPPHR